MLIWTWVFSIDVLSNVQKLLVNAFPKCFLLPLRLGPVRLALPNFLACFFRLLFVKTNKYFAL